MTVGMTLPLDLRGCHTTLVIPSSQLQLRSTSRRGAYNRPDYLLHRPLPSRLQTRDHQTPLPRIPHTQPSRLARYSPLLSMGHSAPGPDQGQQPRPNTSSSSDIPRLGSFPSRPRKHGTNPPRQMDRPLACIPQRHCTIRNPPSKCRRHPCHLASAKSRAGPSPGARCAGATMSMIWRGCQRPRRWTISGEVRARNAGSGRGCRACRRKAVRVSLTAP